MTDGTGMAGEAGRLAALQRYQILDTGPEKAFDELTFLVSHDCAAHALTKTGVFVVDSSGASSIGASEAVSGISL